MKVFVVEDERRISQFLKKGLTEKGYAVDVAGDADAALERIVAASPDLVILDLLLPGSRDGIELCRELRARGVHSKILMLTARDTVENKIEGSRRRRRRLPRQAVLFPRAPRPHPRPPAPHRGPGAGPAGLRRPVLRAGGARGRARPGVTVRLTVREGALFELLLRRRGKVVSRAEIQARIWDDSFDLSTNIIDVYINALRKKIDGGAGRS